MADSKEVTIVRKDTVHILQSPAYYDAEVGGNVHKAVHELFKQGFKRFVIDFSACKVANSTGISSVMDLALKVLDDYHGSLVLCNLDPSKESVFAMVGIIPLIPLVKTLEEAVTQASVGT